MVSINLFFVGRMFLSINTNFIVAIHFIASNKLTVSSILLEYVLNFSFKTLKQKNEDLQIGK